ncbi:PREDICTED: olfactory receptor 14C36-like, partial [Buceros rhinoceros silvestris]|uniref:olfactory receptor 14C36-like n=1 Tax=Buceros rhinoceros silvestris TaxID=175836 RepID=UPI00052830E3
MANSLWDTRDISYAGCAAQLFLYIFLISAEFSLLTVMAYDRYVAICKPLHYRTLLGSTTGPSWAAELVSTWQQLPGALGSSLLCCTRL